ncbi:LacI family DNA-binding transcriptional regulator [Enterovibrio sp. ZSDZ35]|uniref:LacI family DNA-binding transcriptional regulator n=1 Tax=Enterovibrio qingdaonensis TaxID=2899818 RepID=A0ABT5QPR5_9GAMM|nr:LacI family DNA-binding transcriptional regulator [Enterovibrio sp. ZSDZ35]MDD1782981.1 LacI family DNA-binding transcriptional regulator [Enterovibrio sp. ZSDZ35]
MVKRKSPRLAEVRKATVIDVAKAAGVSKSTVSLVLRGSEGVKAETVAKVNIAIEQLGYVYNRDAASLRNKESNLIAIVANDLANPYLAQVIMALEAELERRGFMPVVVNINESVARQTTMIASLREHNVAGYFMTPAPETQASWLKGLASSDHPVICLMRDVAGSDVPYVMPDNVKGVYLATQYLISLGHKRIAFVGGVETISDYQERKQGFIRAMEEAQLPIKAEDIVPSSTKREGGKVALHRVLDSDNSITAVMCFTDVVAYGVYSALMERGLTPGKEIAVVGFDDLEDSRLMSPALTTVKVRAEDIGRVACERLQQWRENNSVPESALVGVELVVRASCCSVGERAG